MKQRDAVNAGSDREQGGVCSDGPTKRTRGAGAWEVAGTHRVRETGHPLCVRPWASGDQNDGKQLKTGDSGSPGSPSLAQRRLWPLHSPAVGYPPFLPRPFPRRKFPRRNAWKSEPAPGPAGPRRGGRPGVASPRR